MPVEETSSPLSEMVGKRHRWAVVLMAGLMLLIFACSTEPAPDVPGTVEAPVSVAVESTPTPSPEATSTPTPQHTETPEPTSSPTNTPIPPPGPVQGLRATDVTEDSITLVWDYPTDDDAVAVERYEVTRDVSFGPDEHNFVVEPTFTDVGLREGTEYKYRVRAIGTEGVEGAEINIEESTLRLPTPEPTVDVAPPTATPPPTPTPSQPALPTLTPIPTPGVVQSLRVTNVTEDSITLHWDPPTNSDVIPVEHYEVTRDVSFGSDERNIVADAMFTDVGLSESTEHRYRIRAIGPGGVEGTDVNIEATTLAASTPDPTPTPVPTATAVPPTPTPEPTATPTPAAPIASPVATLRGLTIADEYRCSEYDSDDYPYPPSVEHRIVEQIGGVYGPYTGSWFANIRETDIEHIVARSEAHDSGLCAADAETRKTFASDLLNLTLASPSVNRHQKVDNDVAEWLPDLNSCWYADRVVQVRAKYGLTVDQREADALDTVLSGCSSFEMIIIPASEQATPTPIPTPATARVYDSCDAAESAGEQRVQGSKGPGKGFPQTMVPSARDGDKDGVVCEK